MRTTFRQGALLMLVLLTVCSYCMSGGAPSDVLVYINDSYLRKTSLNGTKLEDLLVSKYGTVQGCDFDARNDYLFWSEVSFGKEWISRSRMDGSDVQILLQTGITHLPGSIAWDWVNKKLYWTDVYDDDIEVFDPLTNYRKVLFETDRRSRLGGIVIDPSTRMMYWTDHGSSPRIEKASMDGTLRTVIHSTGLVLPVGITLDYTTQTLYWVDSSLERMESSDVNGLNRRVLITAGIQHPLAIDVFQGTLFWTESDRFRGAILSAHVAQPNNSRVIVPNVIGPVMAIKVVSLERQQPAANPCGRSRCSHLCLLSAGEVRGFSCACPTGMVLLPDELFCLTDNTTMSCSRLPSPSNGVVIFSSSLLTVGTTAKYRCISGFSLVGSSSRTCLSSGLWSGGSPFCQRYIFNCSRLSSPPNGAVTFSSSSLILGTIATYTCDLGYSLVGSSSRKCLPSGSWSYSQPYCRQLVNCSRLSSPPNGAVTFSSSCLSFGTIATYTCVSGYSLVGSSSRICLSSGSWSGSQPYCQRQGSVPSDFLVYINDRYLRKTSLNGTKLEDLLVSNYGTVEGFDFDARNDYLFWSEVKLSGQKSISRSRMDGSDVQILLQTGIADLPVGIAWDWVNKKLYWTDLYDDDIEVFDPLTNYRKVLFETGHRSRPRGIVVDPSTRMMYWTDHGSSPRIEKASMDGTLRTVIHSTGLVRPGGITLDYTTQTLYWVDSSLDRMESSDVNGLNRRVLITAGIQHPLAIDVFQGTLFWTDSDRGAILSAHVAQPNNSRVIVPNVIGAAMAVKVVSLERQQSASNPCGRSRCSHLCLLSASEVRGFSCACPTGMVLLPDELFCLSTCRRLSSPSNGAVTFSSSSLSSGTIATYTCDSGYSLVGSSSRTCVGGVNMYWTGSPPSCRYQAVVPVSEQVCIQGDSRRFKTDDDIPVQVEICVDGEWRAV